MKCEKTVTGMVYFWNGEKVGRSKREITVWISDKRKTMSVTDEKTDFKITIPLEPIEGMLEAAKDTDTAEWVEREVLPVSDVSTDLQTAKCSKCGRYHTTPYLYFFYEYKYCPHCGRRMKGGKNYG